MSKTTSIITGEAAETDSDDDDCCTNKNIAQSHTASTLQGEIVNGEDSESDTDLKPTIAAAKVKMLSVDSQQPDKINQQKFDSLLHKKLCENNLTVDKNLNNFLSKCENETTTALNNTDRQLMKSQLTLQAALNSLRILNANAICIKYKLRSIVVDDYYLHNLAVTDKWHSIQ